MHLMPSIAPRHLAEKVDRLAEQALDFFAEKELLAELHRELVEAVSQLLDALDGPSMSITGRYSVVSGRSFRKRGVKRLLR